MGTRSRTFLLPAAAAVLAAVLGGAAAPRNAGAAAHAAQRTTPCPRGVANGGRNLTCALGAFDLTFGGGTRAGVLTPSGGEDSVIDSVGGVYVDHVRNVPLAARAAGPVRYGTPPPRGTVVVTMPVLAGSISSDWCASHVCPPREQRFIPIHPVGRVAVLFLSLGSTEGIVALARGGLTSHPRLLPGCQITFRADPTGVVTQTWDTIGRAVRDSLRRMGGVQPPRRQLCVADTLG